MRLARAVQRLTSVTRRRARRLQSRRSISVVARPAACDARSTEAGAVGATPIITPSRNPGHGVQRRVHGCRTAAAIPVWRWRVSSDGGATTPSRRRGLRRVRDTHAHDQRRPSESRWHAIPCGCDQCPRNGDERIRKPWRNVDVSLARAHVIDVLGSQGRLRIQHHDSGAASTAGSGWWWPRHVDGLVGSALAEGDASLGDRDGSVERLRCLRWVSTGVRHRDWLHHPRARGDVELRGPDLGDAECLVVFGSRVRQF